MSVKRIVIASLVLAVAGALAPWNGSAGAAPGHRPDAPTTVRGDATPTTATP